MLKKASLILVTYYIALLAWWLKIFISGQQTGTENYLFNQAYVVFHLTGGITGLYIARKKWGGYTSLVGRGLSFMSIGLLCQGFGQTVWTYYNFFYNIEVPYPSLADMGYFALIPSYIYGMYNFAKASGVRVTLKSIAGRTQVVVIPLVMIVIAFAIFLKDLPLDFSNPIRTFFDWGTPALNAISVSLGILTYSLSKSVLGGRMRIRILFLIFALIFEYITEYLFLYQAGLDVYYNGGVIDLLFATSSLIMTLGILQFSAVSTHND